MQKDLTKGSALKNILTLFNRKKEEQRKKQEQREKEERTKKKQAARKKAASAPPFQAIPSPVQKAPYQTANKEKKKKKG